MGQFIHRYFDFSEIIEYEVNTFGERFLMGQLIHKYLYIYIINRPKPSSAPPGPGARAAIHAQNTQKKHNKPETATKGRAETATKGKGERERQR